MNEPSAMNALPPQLRPEEFELFLQPQHRLEDGLVCSAETLVRWRHPERGLLEPAQFFAEFAEKGLLYALDCLVLEKTCQMLRSWLDCGLQPIPIAVNLFGKTPFKPQWTEWLLSLLRQYSVPTDLLSVEIKEDSYLGSPRATHALVQELQSAGISVALDNYGSGVTSVKTVNGMGVNTLKVDMRFFDMCENIGKSEVVFTAIVRTARWLEMKVIAEHVETAQQKDFAAAAGCDLAQGSYYTEPVAQDRFEGEILPACHGEQAAAAEMQEDVEFWQKTILVIDDSDMERALVKKYLNDEYHIHEAESAEQAIAFLNSHVGQVRLMLVDYIMPGMNGMEFMRFCHSDNALREIPIIMITSNDRASDQKLAFRAGAYDYLTKPLIPEVVRARVQHAMELNKQLLTIESSEEEFRHQAETDKATGLLNKATFEEKVGAYLTAKSGGVCTLMVLDVDNFKSINDHYGHLHGDEVIKVVADTLRTHCRKSDYLGRFGGDEFVVCLTGALADSMVSQKAEAILHGVTATCQQDLRIPASVSIGMADSRSGETFEQLFKRADEALYCAKSGGKGQAAFARQAAEEET